MLAKAFTEKADKTTSSHAQGGHKKASNVAMKCSGEMDYDSAI